MADCKSTVTLENIRQSICDSCIKADVCSIAKEFETAYKHNQTDEMQIAQCDYFKDCAQVVELPCKVGNTLYMFNRNKSNIQEMTLDKPDIRCHCVKDDEFACCMPICNDKENDICAYRFRFDFSEIGKTVFLTREEAERALKEREKNEP